VIGTYAAAILICVAALVIGRAICVLVGHEGGSWLAAPVGFAALMVICNVAIYLPGRGWTAVAAVVIFVAVSVWIGVRRSTPWPSWPDGLPVAAIVLVITAVPFLANGRVGVLGINFLNDTHWHLYLAQGLLQPSIRPLDTYGVGYPLGPHAVAATFAQGVGSSVDKTLTAVLIATPVLTGLAALGAIGDLPRARRWLVATLAAVPYLAVAWYVQSAFKEPIMSLLLIGMVLALQARNRGRFARPEAVLVPLAVLIAGVMYDYSYPGLVWPAAVLVCWAVLEVAFSGAWRRIGSVARDLRAVLPELGLAVALLVVLVLPDANRIYMFWQSNGGTAVGTTGGVVATSLANLAGPLSTLEGFNLWLWGDFRFAPPDALAAGALAGFGVLLLLFAIVRALERRELAWVGSVMGTALVYAYVKHSQSPYVAAKALAIPGPLLALGVGAALMRQLKLSSGRLFALLGAAAAAVAFFFFAFESSYLSLTDATVGPVDHTNELRSLRKYLHDRPTLVLFYDDYFKWELLGVPASSPLLQSPGPAVFSPAKPWTYGQPLDFNSVDAHTLNSFDYVITTRTDAQSEPPPNFHLVASSRSYEVWKRVGLTEPFFVLPESGNPGAILDCSKPADRRISREHGFAMVRAAPTYVPVPPLAPGGTATIFLHLAPGSWNLSLPFVSSQAVTITAPGLHVWLPPNLDRSGSIWPVGTVHSTGAPVPLTITMADPGVLGSERPATQFFTPEPLVAVPDRPESKVPLSDACGRYVDWYQLT